MPKTLGSILAVFLFLILFAVLIPGFGDVLVNITTHIRDWATAIETRMRA